MAIKWETKVIMEEPKATISAGAIGLNGTASEFCKKPQPYGVADVGIRHKGKT